jgi:hypothetical protein
MIPVKRKSRWFKPLLIGLFALILIGAGIYWYIATDTFADTSSRRASYRVEATPFIHEFETNDSLANAKYKDKIIIVTGIVSDVEQADSNSVNIKFVDSTSGSYAIFMFQDKHREEAKEVSKGQTVSIKAAFSGAVKSDILETTVISFQRAAINKKNSRK